MKKFQTENGLTLGGDLVDEETGEIISIGDDDFVVNGKHIQAGFGTWLREDSAGSRQVGFDATTTTKLDFYIGGAIEASLTASGLTGLENLTLADNKNLYLGTGNDFRLYFSGTDTIFNAVAGNLYFQDNGTTISGFVGASFRLYDSRQLQLGSDADWRLSHDGFNAYDGCNTGSRYFQFGGVNTANMSSNGLRMYDAKALYLGTSNDFQMSFDGTDTIFNAVAGDLKIQDNGTDRYTFGTTAGNLTITGSFSGGTITGSSFVKSGGTSSQYLKADGSVTTSVNADLLDSLNSTSFVRSDTNDTVQGSLTFERILIFNNNTTDTYPKLLNYNSQHQWLDGFIAIPKGYTGGRGLTFRMDDSQTNYIFDSASGVSYTINAGTDPGSTAMHRLFTYTNSYINLNSYKNASNNFEFEITGLSISNSSNSQWAPYVLFHSGGTAVTTITVHGLEGDGTTWTQLYSGDGIDVIYPTGYTSFSTGILKGLRFSFSGITGNSYLKMVGATSRTSASFAWQMLKDGGEFYGEISGKDAGTEYWSLTNTGQLDIKKTFNNAIGSNGSINFTNSTGNFITFSNNGVAPPTTTTRSAGTKVVWYQSLSSVNADYATGIASSTFWNSIPSTGNKFAWYSGTTEIATLNGDGDLAIDGDLTVTGNVVSPTLTGTPTAPTATSGTNTTQIATTAFVTSAVSAAGGGDVSKVGTPANNQLGVWTGDGTIEGDSDLTWDTNVLLVSSAQATPLRLNGTGTQSRVAYYKSSTAKWSVGVNDNDDFSFYDSTNALTPITIQDGSPSNTLFVASSGRVGISTFQPQTTLDVNGTITSTEIQGRAVSGSTTTGTIGVDEANTKITMTGNITIPSGTYAQDDVILFDGNGAGYTLTPASGLTLYVNGSAVTNPSTVSVGANDLISVAFRSGTVAIVSGVVESGRLFSGDTLLSADGSVSAVGFGFSNDVDTGFYLGGTADMRLALGGSNLLRFVAGRIDTYGHIDPVGTTIDIGNSSGKFRGIYATNAYIDSIDMGTNTFSDTSVGNWNTAYGWGDHSAAGYQAGDADLTAIAALAKTDGNIIVGNGSTWVAESGATARTSLGLGTGDSPTFTNVTASGHFDGPAEHSSTTSGTLAAGDMNTTISATGGITINNSIGSQGDIVIVYNNSASNITITQGTGVTLRLAGTATTGNRTIAQRGIACIYYHSASDVAVGGTGVT